MTSSGWFSRTLIRYIILSLGAADVDSGQDRVDVIQPTDDGRTKWDRSKKKSRIFLCRNLVLDGAVKLCGLSSAQKIGGSHTWKPFDPIYAAPERSDESANFDQSVDVCSFGRVAQALVRGCHHRTLQLVGCDEACPPDFLDLHRATVAQEPGNRATVGALLRYRPCLQPRGLPITQEGQGHYDGQTVVGQ